MRRPLLLAIAIFAIAAAPAAAHVDPPGCVNSDLQLNVTANRTSVRPGDQIVFSVSASNASAGACNITAATVTLRLPGVTGTSTGDTKTLTTTGTYGAGTNSNLVGSVAYTVAVNPGVTALAVRANATFTAHTGAADETDTAQRGLGVTVTQPALELTAAPNPSSGLVPFASTVSYGLKNTSSTMVGMTNPVITDPGCSTVTRTHPTGDNVLDNGETWTYACQVTLSSPTEIHANVIASTLDPIDQAPVFAPTVPWTVKASAPPRPHFTLTKTASPASGFAPFTTRYTYVVFNDGPADARPVQDISIDDSGCSPAAPTTSAATLALGEELTFTCDFPLTSALSVTSSAVAIGKDGYDGALTYSNQATTTVSASIPPVVVPAPDATNPTGTPTPTPTPTPTTPAGTPIPAPKPSTRVKFAYTGRFSPAKACRGKAALTLTAGKKKVATTKVRLDSKCRFKVRFDVARTRLAKATKVTVTAKASGKKTVSRRLPVPKT